MGSSAPLDTRSAFASTSGRTLLVISKWHWSSDTWPSQTTLEHKANKQLTLQGIAGGIKDPLVPCSWFEENLPQDQAKIYSSLHLVFIIFSVQRPMHWPIEKRTGSESKPKRKEGNPKNVLRYSVSLASSFHVKVVELCEFKGVRADRSPAAFREQDTNVVPQRLVIQHARGQLTLEETET